VRSSDDPPYTFLERGGTWPHGLLKRDAPPSAHLAQALAQRLELAMKRKGLTLRAAAERCGTTHPTLQRLLDGRGLPDARTVLLLEVGLRIPLWPNDLFLYLTGDEHKRG
jgi:hypothetical protein